MFLFALYILDISKLEMSCALRMSLKNSRRCFGGFFCVSKCGWKPYIKFCGAAVLQFPSLHILIFNFWRRKHEPTFLVFSGKQEDWDIFEMLLNSLPSQVRRGLLIVLWYSRCKDDSCIDILNFYFAVLKLLLTPVKLFWVWFLPA